MQIETLITSAFKNASGNFTVDVEPYGQYAVDAEFYADGAYGPVIEIEYINNEGKKKTSVQEFTLAGELVGRYDVTTGDASIAFEDVAATDSVLGVGISHVYKKSAEDFHVGKNFRLSLNEKLSKTGAAALDADYVYTDSFGMKHGFKDTYYYIDSQGVKKSISKANVTVEPDGSLYYITGSDKYEVKKEQRTKTGLTVITIKEGFINNKYIDERNQNVIQAEQKLKQLQIQELTNRMQEANNLVEQYKRNNNYYGKLDAYEEIAKKSEQFSKAETEYLFANYPKDEKTKVSLTPALSHENEVYIKTQTITNASRFDAARKVVFNELDGGNYTDEDANENPQIKTAFNYHYSNMLNELKNSMQTIQDNAENQQYFGKTIKDYLFWANQELVKLQNEFLGGADSTTQETPQEVHTQVVQAQHEYEVMKRLVPVNYLTDGKIVKGFNEEGNLVAIFDKYENMMTIEYDETGKITAVYDGEEKQITFDYRPDGLLGSMTDTRGRRIEYDYDDNGNDILISVKKSDGLALSLSYDENSPDYLTEVNTSNKMRAVLEYGDDGLLSTVTTQSLTDEIVHGAQSAALTEQGEQSAAATISKCSFSFGDNLTVLTDDKDNKKYYKIDDLGDVYEYYEEENDLVVKAEKYDHVPYEKDNVQYAKKDSLYTKAYSAFTSADFTGGDTLNIELDEFNNPAKKTTNARALSAGTTQKAVVTYEYNDDHKCVKESAVVTISGLEDGTKTYTQITAYNYNAAGNIVRKESYIQGEEHTAGKSIEETEYDEKGNAVRSYSYNSLDSSSKFYTESEYAENGRTLADYDETGENKTEYEYIPGTHVVRTQKNPNGSKFSYGYDVDDTVTSITQSTEEGEENSTQTRYTCGEVTELVSGNNKVNYAYEAKRRVSKISLNGTENYIVNTYTDDTTEEGIAGTVDICVSTNANNESVTSYTDKQGKVRRITTSAGKHIDYAYNAKGETTSVSDGVSGNTEAYGYDNDYDRLKKYTRNAGKPSEYTETYAYDGYGQVSSVTQSGAAERTYTYAYKETAAHELASITTGMYKFSPQTDKLGRNAGREVWNNNAKLAAEYIYYRKVGDHATNMPSAVYFGKKSGEKFPITENIKYAYDRMGNISRIDENGIPVVWYKYDALNRLIREDNKTFGKTWLYSYDNNGNILCKRETAFTLKENVEESEFESVQYEYEGDKLLAYGTEACEYDAIGNPTTYRGKSVSWSNGRQMVNYNTTAFTYDGLGRRLSKGTINYTYDGNNRIIKQSNGIEFIYDNSGVAGIVYNSATYVYRKDGQGNICALIDSNGNVVVQYKYDAWGNHAVLYLNKVNDKEQYSEAEDAAFDENYAKNKTLAELNPFRYRGYYYDEETGLYYLKSRYYDPEVGRFITIDDISYLDPETINGLNLYAYCGNNPVMNVDPNGTFLFSLLIAIVVGAVFSTAASIVGQLATTGTVNWAQVGISALFGAVASGLSVTGIGGIVGQFLIQGSLAALETVSLSAIDGTLGQLSVGEIFTTFVFAGLLGSIGAKGGAQEFKRISQIEGSLVKVLKRDFIKAGIQGFKQTWIEKSSKYIKVFIRPFLRSTGISTAISTGVTVITEWFKKLRFA